MKKEIILQPTKRWIIRDCNADIIGRPMGYLTHARAYNAVSKTQRVIWDRFNDRRNKDNIDLYDIIPVLVQTQCPGGDGWCSYKEIEGAYHG